MEITRQYYNNLSAAHLLSVSHNKIFIIFIFPYSVSNLELKVRGCCIEPRERVVEARNHI
jgi:hypothetical protein